MDVFDMGVVDSWHPFTRVASAESVASADGQSTNEQFCS